MRAAPGAVAAAAAVVMVGLTGGALLYQLTTGSSSRSPSDSTTTPGSVESTPVSGPSPRAGSLEVFASKDPFAPAGESSSGERDGIRIEMVASREGFADFRVGSGTDTRTLEVAVGEVFESYLQLLALEDGCAVLLFGDEQFSMCRGDHTVR